MPKNVKLLLADLQRVVQQMSDENGKEEGQLASFIHQAVQCGAMSGDEAVEFA